MRHFAACWAVTREEVLQLNVTDWDTQWPREEVVVKIKEFLSHPAVFETRHCRKDGTCFDVEISVIGVTLEGQEYLYASARDITGRKKAEQERRNLRAAVEQSANTIVITDTCGTIEYVNPAFEKTTGYSSSEALGQNPRILKSGEQDVEFYRDLWATINAGKTWRGELHNRRKDGSLYWESATISPVHDSNGRTVHFIAIKENITERKAIEASLADALVHAEAGNRAKSEFLAIMSHELRTPLNGVLGFAELLAETTSLDEEQKSFVETISSSGNHLLSIVSDILDFSSIEKGTLAIHVGPMVIADLVEASVETIWKSTVDKGISLQTEVGPGVPEQILGDDRRTRQILINLLGNAVKFTSSGSVTLCVATATEGGRQFVDFSVKDTGIGMSPETIEILFQPFTQADMKLNRTFGGTGLGLAVSRRLADAMGGKITVISTPGQGSTFTLRLPIENDSSSPGAGGSSQSIAQGGILPDAGENHSIRPVLVVEDDKNNRMLAGKMLQMLGYQVEFAADGAEALAAFAPGKYSVILMDIQMPVMNGIEATGKIRELESGTHVPIVALTAKVMPGDRERCLDAGMDDFLSKPFKKAELASKLAGIARQD